MRFTIRKAVSDDFVLIAELAKELGYKSGNAIMEIKLVEMLNSDNNSFLSD
jgi:hypothetical protein